MAKTKYIPLRSIDNYNFLNILLKVVKKLDKDFFINVTGLIKDKEPKPNE